MVEQLSAPSDGRNLKRLDRVSDVTSKSLEDFVTSKSLEMLNSLCVDQSFLEVDPDSWNDSEPYKKARLRVNELRVVNDCAERGVALITQYNDILTKNEEQRQYLLQVVQQYRGQFKTPKKSTLVFATDN